jgi:hypothetical protein
MLNKNLNNSHNMASESYLLQFCYQCDLKGPIGDSFEVLKKRIQWNFESYLEDLPRKNRELTEIVTKSNDIQKDSNSGLVTFYKRRFWQPSFKSSLTVQTVGDEMKWNKSPNPQKKYYGPNLQNFKSENPPIIKRQFKQKPDNYKIHFNGKMCQR